jgi:hypothetical protein
MNPIRIYGVLGLNDSQHGSNESYVIFSNSLEAAGSAAGVPCSEAAVTRAIWVDDDETATSTEFVQVSHFRHGLTVHQDAVKSEDHW